MSCEKRTQKKLQNLEETISQEEMGRKVLQLHVWPPPTPLVKSKHNDKSEKDFVKIKLIIYMSS